MFTEAFHSMIEGIHLALEVKTSFGTLHLRWAPVHNPVLISLDFPLTAIISIAEKKRRRTSTQKVTKQSLSDYTQQD
jgi:hypothetical protein